MKIIVLGDIHGRTVWKDIITKENPDKVIFIGDYVDSFDVPWDVQLNNLSDIIQYRIDNPDKVVTLLGNHDFHYTRMCTDRYSGYQQAAGYQFTPLIENAITAGLFIAVYRHENFLFTHAGLTNTWCKFNNVDLKGDFVTQINEMLEFQGMQFNFQGRDPYGDDPTQGPMWVRLNSLQADQIPGFTQVVGHTDHEHITRYGDNIIAIDALRNKEYLVIEDGVDTPTKFST